MDSNNQTLRNTILKMNSIMKKVIWIVVMLVLSIFTYACGDKNIADQNIADHQQIVESEVIEDEWKYHSQMNAEQNISEIEAYKLYKELGGTKNPYEYYTDSSEETSSSTGASSQNYIYNKAIEEQNKGHYVYANLLFSEILDYEDAQERYDQTSELLGMYNGHYDIALFAGGTYTIDLENGMGILTFNHGEKYIVEMLGLYVGISELPIMSLIFIPMDDDITELSDWFNKNNSEWYYSDRRDMYQIMLIYDETKTNAMIIACDGNNYKSFNGYGTFKQSK